MRKQPGMEQREDTIGSYRLKQRNREEYVKIPQEKRKTLFK